MSKIEKLELALIIVFASIVMAMIIVSLSTYGTILSAVILVFIPPVLIVAFIVMEYFNLH